MSRALLDFWHADTRGEYDNSAFVRGHQFTKITAAIGWRRIVPGVYPGRMRPIHLKVQAPGTSILTSQLYSSGEVRNQSDWLFRRDLLVMVIYAGKAMRVRFDFIVVGAAPAP